MDASVDNQKCRLCIYIITNRKNAFEDTKLMIRVAHYSAELKTNKRCQSFTKMAFKLNSMERSKHFWRLWGCGSGNDTQVDGEHHWSVVIQFYNSKSRGMAMDHLSIR